MVGHGYAFDLVESWDDDERLGQFILVETLKGREWDWDRGGWVKKT